MLRFVQQAATRLWSSTEWLLVGNFVPIADKQLSAHSRHLKFDTAPRPKRLPNLVTGWFAFCVLRTAALHQTTPSFRAGKPCDFNGVKLGSKKAHSPALENMG